MNEHVIDNIKWALDHYGNLVDQRKQSLGWKPPCKTLIE